MSAPRRRERLASPLALGAAALVFAAAFAWLAPARESFRIATEGTPADGAAAVDELRLAYLRARGTGGELDAEETFAALLVLAGEGRIEEARALLDASPAAVLDEARRLRLDLELAAGVLARASVVDPPGGVGRGTSPERARAHDRLLAVLARLLEPGAPRDRETLERAAALAVGVGETALGARVHERLASVDAERAAHWYARCGRTLAAAGLRAEAADCLLRAREASAARDAAFALGVELLGLIGVDGASVDSSGRRPSSPAARPPPRAGALAEALLGDRLADVDELVALAETLLAIERPGLAARAYARLAERDATARQRWLAAAARWSEAAGRPAEAAVYLDAMAPPAEADASAAHRRRIEALLVGAGRTREALGRAARRIAAAPDDAATAREAIALARAAGEDARALGWNTRLLQARPDDDEALERQATLALALGRPDLARAATERRLALAPGDPTLLDALARLAEWSGEPEAALRHRRRLATLRGTRDDLLETARLAELLRRPAIAAEALETLARREPPDAADLRRLVLAYELDGRPDAAARALEALAERPGTTARALRELAALHTRHRRDAQALDAWTRLAAKVGRSTEETLARTELLWRLGERDAAAELATGLGAMTFGGQASDYQTRLLAEIGWRYRLPVVAALARPRLAGLAEREQRLLHGRRAVESLVAAGDAAGARREAERLWREEGDVDSGLTALGLALEHGERASAERLLAAAEASEAMRARAAFWSLAALAALRADDPARAERAYERALDIDPDDDAALAGLLWLHIDRGEHERLAARLDEARGRAERSPALRTPFAFGRLALGEATASLPWFARALDTPGADYGLWLGYADALDAAGRVDAARRVRRHALLELRPRLLEAIGEQRETLLRHYGTVLARHAGTAANEAWMRYLLAVVEPASGEAEPWREEMAVAWLMSTERHEHARLILARRHEARLETPLWQDLALALRADDLESVRAMLESGGGLSAGDRIVALRRVGREADAMALALRTLERPATPEDRRVAAAEYASLRRARPSHATVLATDAREGELAIAERGFALRHTFEASGIGIGLDVVRRRFESGELDVGAGGTRSSVGLALLRESDRRSLRVALGIVDDGEDDLVEGSVRHAWRDRTGRRELAVEVAGNEAADESAELRLGGKRDRVGVDATLALGERGFVELGAAALELATRRDDRRLARGLRTRAAIGLRGRRGALAWSGALRAADARHDRVDTLPPSLALGADSTLDAVLARRTSTLALDVSLGRGTVGDALPEVAAPRWHVDGTLARAWPDGAVGARLGAAAGLRVLGNDELALAFERRTHLGGERSAPDSTSVGLSYRRHF